ncbi:MAG: D-alanine--D-alanine ligase [Bacteroidota bacterium]
MIKAAIIMGGQSAEHEVSLQSGRSIFQAIDKSKYDVELIGIDKQGNWFSLPHEGYLANEDDPDNIALITDRERQVALIPFDGSHRMLHIANGKMTDALDVAFCIVHGTFGEDGGAQGYFNMLNLPFVGPDILGAAVGMDKDTAKQVLLYHGIAVADYVCYHRATFDESQLEQAVAKLGFPMFVKPSSSGSSIGVKKANDVNELLEAIHFAFQYDQKVLVECFVDGREIECSVLGNDDAKASLPGEIVPLHEFYSYEAKYIDKQGAKLEIPAKIPADLIPRLQDLAVKTYHALNCAGLARVDFFLTKENELIINEINTLPGFTSISMYPKLWAVSGLPYSKLIDELLQLAISRHQQKQKTLNNILTART